MLRYGIAWRRSRLWLQTAGAGQVVAGDRLRLRAAVLAARERIDDVRRLAVDVEVEHVPTGVGGFADDELVPGSVCVAVAPDRGFSHRGSSFLSVGLACAREVGGFLEPRGDREQRAGLFGEQTGERPLERDERVGGVQQRAGRFLERRGAVGEQPLDRPLGRERGSREAGRSAASCWYRATTLGGVGSWSLIGPRRALASDAIPQLSAGSRRPTR